MASRHIRHGLAAGCGESERIFALRFSKTVCIRPAIRVCAHRDTTWLIIQDRDRLLRRLKEDLDWLPAPLLQDHTPSQSPAAKTKLLSNKRTKFGAHHQPPHRPAPIASAPIAFW